MFTMSRTFKSYRQSPPPDIPKIHPNPICLPGQGLHKDGVDDVQDGKSSAQELQELRVYDVGMYTLRFMVPTLTKREVCRRRQGKGEGVRDRKVCP